jgi:hypothetical protein
VGGLGYANSNLGQDQKAAIAEEVTVTGSSVEALPMNGRNLADLAMLSPNVQTQQSADYRGRNEMPKPQAPSQNVTNLQRRVSGVLPVGVDVPRTGTSHRFMRPLVLDEETTLSFRYKTR